MRINHLGAISRLLLAVLAICGLSTTVLSAPVTFTDAPVLSAETNISGDSQAANSSTPVIQAESQYDMQVTIEHLKDAIIAHQYRIVRIQNALDGISLDKTGPVIIYFCNFHFLHDALQRNMNIGPLLPCHIVVSEEKGKVRVYAPNPTSVAGPLVQDNKFLKALCDQVTRDYKDIIWEGTV